jgi:hypothetical protein
MPSWVVIAASLCIVGVALMRLWARKPAAVPVRVWDEPAPQALRRIARRGHNSAKS